MIGRKRSKCGLPPLGGNRGERRIDIEVGEACLFADDVYVCDFDHVTTDLETPINNLGPTQLDLLSPFTRFTPMGGTAIEDPPGEREGSGMYLAYLRDPDGNKLCALHRIQQ